MIAGLVPYFDSLPATNVTVLHSDVLTCRTPPRIHPVVASVGIRSKHSSNISHSRTAPDAQFSYADKTGMVLAELVAEILVMGWDDYGEPRLRRSGTGLSVSNNESGDRTEPRLGGLGDLLLSSEEQGGVITIHIRDIGPGIPKQHLGWVFDPFFSTKGPGEGSGLGLPVAQRLVKKVGGVIRLECPEGKGSIDLQCAPR